MIPQEIISHEEGKFHIPADSVNYDDRTKVLNHSDSFAIFDRWGDIHPFSKKAHGIFHQGTRFINKLEFRINKKKPLLLSSSIKEDNDALSVDLTNPDFSACDIPENTLHLSRSQFIRNGVYYEEVTILNYSEGKCEFDLSFSFGADFKDLFEIRGIQRTLHPHKPELIANDKGIVFKYTGLDEIQRRTEIIFSESGAVIKGHQVQIPFSLEPNRARKFSYVIMFRTEESFYNTEAEKLPVLEFKKAKQHIQEDLQKIRGLFADISTSNEQFTHWLNRSRSDLVSLLTPTPHGLYPYAGVPWYNTAFGRDGIITAMETLWIAPEISRNALLFLAKMQATEDIPSKDAEPGKILHETRSGEMANTGEIPFKEYYGTIDATPLFIMLAGMYYQHTGDLKTIRQIWPQVKAGLEWIDNYGDLDGDGFVEYKHKAENGLTNQGWKDSHDSVMHANGEFCEPPIALCEVQGYVYAAKSFASLLAKAFNENEFADRMEREALELRRKFNEVFWDPSTGCFALALDGNKKPCRVVSSNPGHCLFTGIVDPQYAKVLAQTLLGKEMNSGWGIRTLAAGEKRYNPMSYHNGSIWPHDNALIASGLSRYGFQKEAMDIMSSLFDASLFIDMQRLPELYCGFDRRQGEGPTAYPVACSPQAWSVAAVFMLLQSCLRVEINALEKRIVFNKPKLPEYLNKVTIKGLKTGDSYCDVEMFRHTYDVGFNFMHKPKGWELLIRK